MSSTPNASPAVRLALDGELTIYRAAELKPVLLAALDGAAQVELDLSAVTEVDTSGVQLLMLAKRTALSRGIALRLAAHSAPVVDAIELLDLAAFFGDALVVPPSMSAA
jgi:anti-sigma B factor antagonist